MSGIGSPHATPRPPSAGGGGRSPTAFRLPTRRSGRIPALPYPPARWAQRTNSGMRPFCMYYGSEYINHDVARSRHSNDNGLVEANNGRGDPQALGLWLHRGAARRSDHGVLWRAPEPIRPPPLRGTRGAPPGKQSLRDSHTPTASTAIHGFIEPKIRKEASRTSLLPFRLILR
jgi:hypothetical protein